MENASEGTHSNKNSRSISSEESAGLSASTFGLPRHSHWRCSGKNKHPWATTQQSSLLQKCGKKYLERTSDYYIWKWYPYLDQHRLHLCHVSSHASVHVLQTARLHVLQSQLYCAVTPFEQNFTELVSSRQHQVFYHWWVELINLFKYM